MKRLTKIYNNTYFVETENVQKEQNGYAGEAMEYLGELEKEKCKYLKNMDVKG